MQKKEELFQEMIAFGYTQQQIDDIVDGLAPDYYDALLEMIIDGSDEAYLKAIENRLKAATSQTEKDSILDEALLKIFGDNMKSKKEEALVTLVAEAFEKGKELRKLYQKYQDKDPATVKMVEDIMKTDEYKQMQKDLADSQ